MALKKEDPPAPVPIWVLSFGDMVTNLMACFVMLQALASTQDKTLFNAGIGSFRRAVSQYGLPNWMVGKEPPAEFDYAKIKYPMDEAPGEPDWEMKRIIDADDDRLKELFAQIQSQMQTNSHDMATKPLQTVLLRQGFARDSCEVDPQMGQAIDAWAGEFKAQMAGRAIQLYVVARSADAPTDKACWTLSARRAKAVETRLRGLLDVKAGTLEMYSWGVGSCTEQAARIGLAGDAAAAIVVMELGAVHGG